MFCCSASTVLIGWPMLPGAFDVRLIDEVYYSSEPTRQPGKRLPPGRLKYACPGCGNEWRVTDDKITRFWGMLDSEAAAAARG